MCYGVVIGNLSCEIRLHTVADTRIQAAHPEHEGSYSRGGHERDAVPEFRQQSMANESSVMAFRRAMEAINGHEPQRAIFSMNS